MNASAKKSLAEAGRRKLEEFRKAKQQAGKKPDDVPDGTAFGEPQHQPSNEGIIGQSAEAQLKASSEHGPASMQGRQPTPPPTAAAHHAHDSFLSTPSFLHPPTSVTVITDGAIPFLSRGSPSSNGHHDQLFHSDSPATAFLVNGNGTGVFSHATTNGADLSSVPQTFTSHTPHAENGSSNPSLKYELSSTTTPRSPHYLSNHTFQPEYSSPTTSAPLGLTGAHGAALGSAMSQQEHHAARPFPQPTPYSDYHHASTPSLAAASTTAWPPPSYHQQDPTPTLGSVDGGVGSKQPDHPTENPHAAMPAPPLWTGNQGMHGQDMQAGALQLPGQQGQQGESASVEALPIVPLARTSLADAFGAASSTPPPVPSPELWALEPRTKELSGAETAETTAFHGTPQHAAGAGYNEPGSTTSDPSTYAASASHHQPLPTSSKPPPSTWVDSAAAATPAAAHFPEQDMGRYTEGETGHHAAQYTAQQPWQHSGQAATDVQPARSGRASHEMAMDWLKAGSNGAEETPAPAPAPALPVYPLPPTQSSSPQAPHMPRPSAVQQQHEQQPRPRSGGGGGGGGRFSWLFGNGKAAAGAAAGAKPDGPGLATNDPGAPTEELRDPVGMQRDVGRPDVSGQPGDGFQQHQPAPSTAPPPPLADVPSSVDIWSASRGGGLPDHVAPNAAADSRQLPWREGQVQVDAVASAPAPWSRYADVHAPGEQLPWSMPGGSIGPSGSAASQEVNMGSTNGSGHLVKARLPDSYSQPAEWMGNAGDSAAVWDGAQRAAPLGHEWARSHVEEPQREEAAAPPTASSLYPGNGSWLGDGAATAATAAAAAAPASPPRLGFQAVDWLRPPAAAAAASRSGYSSPRSTHPTADPQPASPRRAPLASSAAAASSSAASGLVQVHEPPSEFQPSRTFDAAPPEPFAPTTSYALSSSYLPSAVTRPAADNGGPGSGSRLEPSFLESYLDTLLRLDDGEGPDGKQQQHSGAGSTREREGTATATALSRRASSSGDGDGDRDGDSSRRVSSSGEAGTGAEAGPWLETQEGDGSQRKGAGEGRGPGEPAAGLAGSRGAGLPPRPPSGQGHASHRRQESGDSFASHDVNGRLGSGSGSQQFTLLQQHIDELTEQKLGLQRGMAQQVRMAEGLAQENQALAEQYNAQAQLVDALQKKIQRYEDELEAQVLALEGLASEREAARALAQDTAQRLSSVAAEVVQLEQALMEEKSARMRSEEAGAASGKAVARLERRVAALQREAAEAEAELARQAVERRGMVVRLKQTEAKLERAEQQQRLSGPAAAVPAAPPLPPPSEAREVVEREVQCELLQPHTGLASASALGADAPQVAGPVDAPGQEAAAAGHAAEVLGASLAQLTVQGSGADLEAAGQVGPAAADDSDDPSAVLAERALSALGSPSRSRGAAAGGGGGADPLALLSRWLPRGPISGSSPVSAIVEEEVRAVHSVHALLAEYEGMLQELVQELEQARVDNMQVLQANQQLQHQLLSVTGQGGMHSPGDLPPLRLTWQEPSLEQWLGHPDQLEPGMVVAGAQGPAANRRPVGSLQPEQGFGGDGNGSSSHGLQGVGMRGVRWGPREGSAEGRAADGHEERQGVAGPPAPAARDEGPSSPTASRPSHGSALATPSPQQQLPYAVMPGALPGLPSSQQQQQQQRRGWMGYLFRGGKKRVREALI